MLKILTQKEINFETVKEFIVSFNQNVCSNELFKVLHINDDELAFWCQRIEYSLFSNNIVVYGYNNNVIGIINIDKIKDIWFYVN